jgi:DNA-binding ferritin-like protein (Dps family)
MKYTGIDKNSDEFAQWLTSCHYPIGNNTKIKKKFNKAEFQKNLTQSHMHGSIEVYQVILTIMKEIGELDDKSLHGQDKFDLVLGEVEQFAVSLMSSFEKRYSKKFSYKPKHSIEDLKERVTKWDVQIEG